MLTRAGAIKILDEIWESGGLSEDMGELISKLKDDFDEREGMLRRFGEVYDGEDKDEYDYMVNEVEDYKDRYLDLKKKYKDRFFGKAKEIEDEQVEDIKRDGTEQTFEDLFKEREN